MRTFTRSDGTTIEVPDNCTICGEAFKSKKTKGIYPYPEKQWLCSDCFTGALNTGLGRLNKSLRGEKLTKDDFKPHSRSSALKRSNGSEPKPQCPKEKANSNE